VSEGVFAALRFIWWRTVGRLALEGQFREGFTMRFDRWRKTIEGIMGEIAAVSKRIDRGAGRERGYTNRGGRPLRSASPTSRRYSTFGVFDICDSPEWVLF
jgi:hypothetical protein